MKIGFVRPLKRHSVAKQRRALIEYGVSESKIYDTTKGERRADAFNGCAAGDILIIYRISCLAGSRAEWREMVADLKGEQLNIEEVSTGRKATLPRVVASMLADALDDWAGGRMTESEAREFGTRGANVRWKGLKRTPNDVAQAIWGDWLRFPTPQDALKHPDMRGWKYGTAYRHLGARGSPAGPSKKRPKKRPETPASGRILGFVYFVQADGRGPVKIGYASTLKDRLNGLSTAHHGTLKVLAAMRGTVLEEREMHKRFAHLRIKGEWFKMARELRNFIKSLPRLPEMDED
jgi:hypothetical protein